MKCPNCAAETESLDTLVFRKKSQLTDKMVKLPQTIYLCHRCKGAWQQEGEGCDLPLKELRAPQLQVAETIPKEGGSAV